MQLPPASFERDKLVRSALVQRFDELSEAARARVLERGVLVASRGDHETSLGEAYLALARRKIPFVVTLDTLFAITFRAIERSLDEVDREAVGTALAAALAATDERLGAESRAARSDTAEPYALARAIIAVARTLIDATADVPRALQDAVSAEVTRVQAHSGWGKSPLLNRVLDYGAFDTQAGLVFGDPRIGAFRAVRWLERATLALTAEPMWIDVARARTHARAAMLLARATNDSWDRIADLYTFATGDGDDPGPRALLAKAKSLGLDLRDEATVGNVVRVDRLRTTLAHDSAPHVNDTSASTATFRLLPPSAPGDARALVALAGTSTHELPSALAIGVALGSADARSVLEGDGVDAHALDLAQQAMPTTPSERHASLHASGLDAIATYLAPSLLDSQRTWRDGADFRRRKLEVALTAWTTLRHASIPFARESARAVIDEPLTSFDDVSGAIEPHAEAIARLVALVRQTHRGLVGNLAEREGAASGQLLERVEALLVDALQVVLAQATGALTPPLVRVLSTMPSRIAAIERRLGSAAAPVVVVAAADPTTGRVLENATGFVSDIWLAVDLAGAASLFVGVRIPFYEMTSTLRATDVSWAKRLVDSTPPAPTWVETLSTP